MLKAASRKSAFALLFVVVLLFAGAAQADFVPRRVPGPGLDVTVPAGWTVWAGSDQGRLSFDNVGGQYAPGGPLPLGGANIQISLSDAGDGSLYDILKKEEQGAILASSVNTLVDGELSPKQAFAVELPDHKRLANIVAYTRHRGRLYRFAMIYIGTDPDASQYAVLFNVMLASVKFRQ